MKKTNYFLFLTALCAALTISSCKKDGDPGPAGTNGTNGKNGTTGLPYKETGTNITVGGTYASDGSTFSNLFTLSFYESLSESSFNTSAPPLRQAKSTGRTSAATYNIFYITRRDSLNNNVLSFEIEDDGGSNQYVNEFYFNLYSNVTSTGYKRVFTYGNGNLGDGASSSGGRASTGPNDYARSLNSSDFTAAGDTITISNWNFNPTTGLLTFNYSGTIAGSYNSTGNPMTFAGAVKASTKQESLRTASN